MVRQLPGDPGVYRFRDARGRVLYLGRATQLRSRVGSYWSDLGDRRHLRPMVAAVTRIEAVACDSVHEATWLERNLLEASMPRWNRVPGGMETPVLIRLDTRPGRPGPRLAYAAEPVPPGVTEFGPYLGSQRVRQALSGLHRVRPLAYTADRLSGAEAAMADQRGVGPADRSRLAAELTAVLTRDPGAVSAAHADLVRVRDRAAGNLAYELAAEVQEEIAALDWITQPQRVTGAAGDFTACGWDGGVLVTLTVRNGRIRQWTQRRVSERGAHPHLTATPADWAAYAHRAARLAAALVPPDEHVCENSGDVKGNL